MLEMDAWGSAFVKALINMMMEYNRWANDRLFADCGDVPAEYLHQPTGTEYETVHKTLDHILLLDHLWLCRLRGRKHKFDSLDQTITSDFEELKVKRELADEELTNYCHEVTEAALSSVVRFKTLLDPAEIEQTIGSALLLLFHLQGHYRAQAQALLKMHGFTNRVLNLMAFQRQTGLGLIA